MTETTDQTTKATEPTPSKSGTGKSAAKPRTRKTQEWRGDFQEVMDLFGAQRGGPVQYDPRSKTIKAWDKTGWHPLAEDVPGALAAYWYVLGRMAEAEERRG